MLNTDNKLFRWGPISACPLFMDFTIEPAFAPLVELFGISYPESLIIFKDGRVTWLMDNNDFTEHSLKFIEKITLNKKAFEKYIFSWNERTSKFVVFLDGLSESLDGLSNDEVDKLFKQFSDEYYKWFTYTISLELASFGLDNMFGKLLKKYLNKEEEFNEVFAILTSPRELTFYRREEKDLLEILKLDSSARGDALDHHQKQYYWILNSYDHAKVINKAYFAERLRKFSHEDFKSIIDDIGSYSKVLIEKQDKLYADLKLSEQEKRIAEAIQIFGHLQDERKEINFKAEHYLEIFVSKLAKKLNLPQSDLKYFLPKELIDSNRRIDNAIIKSRKKCYLLNCSSLVINSNSGEDALKIAMPFLVAKDINESMIHGRVASMGESIYFRGTAKVVLSIDEIGKIKEGEILVTTMTSPDFVVGMKKAGAIITDIGGILSHAAIVSREYKKPCIVGCEIATKVIHDGDIVEIHCGKGTVKIIKSGN